MAEGQREQLLPAPHGHSRTPPGVNAVENSNSVRTKYAWLALYFSLNLALTLYNKAVMGKVPMTFPLLGGESLGLR